MTDDVHPRGVLQYRECGSYRQRRNAGDGPVETQQTRVMLLWRRGPQYLHNRVWVFRIHRLEDDLRFLGPNATVRPRGVEHVVVRQHEQFVGGLPGEIAGAQEEPGADAVAHALANGGDRSRALDARLPPLVGLRTIGAEHSFQPPFVGYFLFP